MAQDLHVLADQTRYLVQGDSLSRLEMNELESRFRTLWQVRDRIADNSHLPLDSDLEQRIQGDMLDLAVLFTHLLVRQAPAEQIKVMHEEALQVLDQAEAMYGPSPVLYRDRQTHAKALGLEEVAQAAAEYALQLVPRTSWEHYSLGLFYFRSKSLAKAGAEFQRAVDMQPDAFWPNFYRSN